MLAIEILFVLPVKFISECASIDVYRDYVALLAIESPYTNYLSIIQMPSVWQAPAADLSLPKYPAVIDIASSHYSLG